MNRNAAMKPAPSSGLIKLPVLWCWIIGGLLLVLGQANASPHGGGPTTITGVVYKQGLVVDGSGDSAPMFAEYAPDTGAVVNWLSQYDASDETLWISNGADYRASATAYRAYRDSLSAEQLSKLRVVSRDEFDTLSDLGSFQPFKGRRNSGSRSLLIYKATALTETLQLSEQKGIIQFESRYDLNELVNGQNQTANSLLLDGNGSIVYASANNTIGFRVAFITPEGPQDPAERFARYTPGDELVAPVTSGSISSGLNPVANFPINPDGKYQAYNIMPMCPGMTLDFLVGVNARLPYRTFNPQRKGGYNRYFLTSYTSYFCAGAPLYPPAYPLGAQLDYIESLAIYESLQTPPLPAHFRIDVTLLSGQFVLSNGEVDTEGKPAAIPLAAETGYSFAGASEEDEDYAAPQARDYNFDGTDDYVSELGSIEAPAGQTTPLYGVWFGDQQEALKGDNGVIVDEDGELIAPDLVRVAQKVANFNDIGLLKTISKEDLRNTDLYVFRESTGELVVELAPFVDPENPKPGRSDVSAEIDGAYFEISIPGRDGKQISRYTWFRDTYEKWQASMNVTEAFQGDVDSLRVGEPIRLVAINRATGYVGTVRTDITASSNSALGVQIPDLVLYPPNLQVEVTRKYEVEYGLTQGEDRKYGVGFEGAALHGDQYLSIHTQWLDRDGSQLPVDLPGMTGRLSSIVSENTLDSSVDHFEIKPGKHIEVLNLNNGSAGVGASHQYLHVVGENKIDHIDFGSTGSGELQYRPAKPVPVKVAVYDEEASRDLKVAQLELADESVKQDSSVYQWVYRPEMMYSVYELAVEGITRQSLNGDSAIVAESDLRHSNTPILSSYNSAIEFTRNLESSDFNPLLYFGPESDLALSLEEYEKIATNDTALYWSTEELAHLNDLDTEDFLSFNLVNNHDVGNVLWEWAFMLIELSVVDDDVLLNDGVVYLDADEPTFTLDASLIGYSLLSDEKKEAFPSRIKWIVKSGQATFSEDITELSESGSAMVSVDVNPKVDNIVIVEAVALGDNIGSQEIFIEVFAGVPTTIAMSNPEGTAYIKGIGEVTVTATVYDKNVNRVVNGTGLLFRERGHINQIKSTGITNNGEVTATFTGGSVEGSFEVVASVGEASATTNIFVNPLSVTIEGLPDQMIAGETYNGMVVVAGTARTDDIFVDIGADKGFISSRDLWTNSLGATNFTYRAPLAPGTYQIGAKVDIENPVTKTVNVVRPVVNRSWSVTRDYLISGYSEPASTNIARFDDIPGTLTYGGNNSITLTGDIGQYWSLTTDDFFFANREPVNFWRFKNLYREQLTGITAQATLVNRVKGPTEHLYALDILTEETDDPPRIENGYWAISDLDIPATSPGISFWLNPKLDGQVMSLGNGALVLNLGSGELMANIKTGDNETTTSLKLSINMNEWHRVAVGVRNGIFYLKIDDDEISKSILDSLSMPEQTQEEYSMILGSEPNNNAGFQGFQGRISGLRIYDWDTEPLMVLVPSEGQYDESGEANVSVELTSQWQENETKLDAITVTIEGAGVDPIPFNVIKQSTINELASSHHAIQSSSSSLSYSSDQVLDALPMYGVFPDPQHAASGILQRFVLSGASESGGTQSVAALQWFSHSNRYPTLRAEVAKLQRVFGTDATLSSFAAEYLQRASIEAANGDDLLLRMMATSLTVWGEMISDNPSAAVLLSQAVENRTDFWSLMRILSLPAEGWAGNVIPVPRPENTCDKFPATINVGTPVAYNVTPCRATGEEMGALLELVTEVDPEVLSEPYLIVTYLTTVLAGLERLPYQYKVLFTRPELDVGWNLNLSPIKSANANILIILQPAVRIFLILVRQTIRQSARAAVPNFVNFFQNGTNSRFSPEEMLLSIAYLSSARSQLPPSAQTALDNNIAWWFTGLGVANRGNVSKKSCTVGGQAHGAALELVGTAAYYALRDIGSKLNISDLERYKIIEADPRKGNNKIFVPLMSEGFLFGENHYGASPHNRVPDLVLQGEGGGNRTWVEFKSYEYVLSRINSKGVTVNTLNRKGNLNKNKWNGYVNSTPLGQYENAHRQASLDFIATTDALLGKWWRGKDYEDLKPSKTVTWFQVWNQEKRTWNEMERKNNSYKFTGKTHNIDIGQPWIGKAQGTGFEGLDKGIVTEITKEFQALQRHLGFIPTKLDPIRNSTNVKPDFARAKVWEFSTGIDPVDYNVDALHVAKTPARLNSVKVRPFTIQNFFKLEAGNGAFDTFMAELRARFGNTPFMNMYKEIKAGTYDLNDVSDLQDAITDEMLEIIGPFKYLVEASRYNPLVYLENKVADYVVGDNVEAIQQFAAELDLPEFLFEHICEDYR